MAERGSDPQLQHFLAAFWKDIDAGSPRPLTDYLAEFPGADASIAREYSAVLDSRPASRWNAAARIGSYRLIRELGRGGQGSVYLAEDERLGRRVALKVLSGVPALSPKAVQRLRREAEITARLDHPGICTTYDFGDSDGTAWIAMRYVEGSTLAARIAAARHPTVTSTSEHLSFPPSGSGDTPETPSEAEFSAPTSARTREDIDWVVGVIERTARALQVAHENGVIHRDIKPANIMVTPDDSPVILDFGLANAVEATGPSITGTGDVMGTPQYIAPEILARDAIQADRRADVYALGVTLYEALTLTRPFDAPTRERLYQAIIAKEPEDPRRINRAISRDLSAVVATAIEKDRDRRYQTALDLAEELRRVRAHQPVLARRAGPLLRLNRWAQRNPAVAIAAGSLFVVLVAALAITSYLLERTNDALAEKERTLTEFQRLSDVKRVGDLADEAKTLFPLLPSKTPEMSAWLRRADAVVGQLPLHETALAEVNAEMAASTGGPSIEHQWKREYLTELVRKLRVFADPDPRIGVLADVRNRFEIARTIRKRSVEDYGDRWRAAIEAIADLARSPRYGGRRIAPQTGLVPIGRNSATGLWEFADIISGSIPDTDGLAADFELEEPAGIVFVLLPGGTFRMGSPAAEPGRKDDEQLQERRIEPFFAGKHEVTQSQWQRVMHGNPSPHRPDVDPSFTLLHPVESVDWGEATDFARRVNARLPSETEWEYACRAGTTTAYCWGDDPEVLMGRANVSDQSIDEGESNRAIIEKAPWRDGFPNTAPVTAMAANEFGLFGFHGNVGEWCRDWYVPEPAADVPDDGGPAPGPQAHKVWRGGSWLMPPRSARSSERYRIDSKTKNVGIGLRLVRPLDATLR